ncbi:ATP-grasp domain-containing protein [Streptomyces piniterrae]|uniref:ATP-grasp domain-containing protein n=1 Tax=Streptomyces piniterrae TaxID=2571125 RepID=UPI00145CC1D4|nr:hypothetical protein [Streptomyces piniterrae]
MPATPAVPAQARERCLELLARLEQVEFVHDLNLDRTHIRGGRVYHGELCLNELDLYVWYAQIDRGPGSYHIEALRTLSHDTRVVIAPESFATGVDKFRSHLLLERAGVRVPDTVLLHRGNVAAAEPVLAEWGRALLKPRGGYFGHGVLLIEDYATLRDVADYVTAAAPGAADETLLLERFYDNDLADWVSVTLVGDSVMYGYRKRPSRWAAMPGGTAKVYDATGSGGEVDLCEVPAAHEELALRAQKALGAQIIGFDMILHQGAPIIVDENTFPGLYPEFFRAAGKDLGFELFRVIARAVDECRTSTLAVRHR